MYDFHVCKACGEQSGNPKYHIRKKGIYVYVCGACGFHYIDHLDDTEILAEESGRMTQEERLHYFHYIEHSVESNPERFTTKVDLVASLVELEGARVLDIGAGGGRFLSLVRDLGAQAYGVEPEWACREYARERYGLELAGKAFEAPHWWQGPPDTFHAITMWDVIEHVNFPIQTLDEAMSRLESGGVLLLDTPARNGFFHRTGVSLYRLSGGRISGPLGMLYSDYRFAHKQIFHPDELRRYAEDRGYRVEVQELFHEISRPYANYLRTYLGSERLARALAPAVSAAIGTARFANKILFAVRKIDGTGSSRRPGLPGKD